VLYTVVGILLALIVTSFVSRDTRYPAHRLPQPASKPESLIGMTNNGFGAAQLFIQGADGVLYEYDGYSWSTATPPDITKEEFCDPSDLQFLQKSAGDISICRQIQRIGEYCPEAIVSVALTPNGDLWQAERTPACRLLRIIPTFIIISVFGFFTSVVIAIIQSRRKTNFESR